MLKSFPPSWNVTHALCVEFCKVTKTQLQETLESLHSLGKLDVAGLLSALQKTIEFEQELQNQYGRNNPITYESGISDADRVRQKYGRSNSRHTIGKNLIMQIFAEECISQVALALIQMKGPRATARNHRSLFGA